MGRYPSWNQTGGYGEPKVYGDLSAVWGEKGPRGKPYLGTLWGNGMSMYAALA